MKNPQIYLSQSILHVNSRSLLIFKISMSLSFRVLYFWILSNIFVCVMWTDQTNERYQISTHSPKLEIFNVCLQIHLQVHWLRVKVSPLCPPSCNCLKEIFQIFNLEHWLITIYKLHVLKLNNLRSNQNSSL